MPEVIIECRDLAKIYKMGGQEVHALHHLTLDIYQGEYLSVMGPSGSERVRSST